MNSGPRVFFLTISHSWEGRIPFLRLQQGRAAQPGQLTNFVSNSTPKIKIFKIFNRNFSSNLRGEFYHAENFLMGSFQVCEVERTGSDTVGEQRVQ